MKRIKFLLIAAVCMVFLSQFASIAKADMLLMPLRVYFKDGERMKALTALNNGSVQAIYRLSFEHKKQLPNGNYLNLTSPLDPNYDPAQWLVYSPRQVDLPPQGKQAIKISLRRPADLPAGEYRVHGVLERIARETIEGRGEGAVTGMMINVGFAVPIIIRVGKYDTTAEVQTVELLPPDPKASNPVSRVELTVQRQGKYSSAGRIEMYWTPPGGGSEIRVNKENSLIIYPEVDVRKVTYSLDRMIQGGSLRVLYRGMEADTGIVFDDRSFALK